MANSETEMNGSMSRTCLDNLAAHFDYFASLFDVPKSDPENEKEILEGIGIPNENERINLTTFRRIIFDNLNIDSSFMYKRVFNAFDVDRKGYLIPKQLISLLRILLQGPIQSQVELALRVYGKPKPTEFNLDQPSPPLTRSSFQISRSDAVECIVESLQLSTPRARHTLTTTSREKAHKVGEDLVSLIFPKLDADNDGIISYDDFLIACAEDDSLIQVFGQFLPKTGIVFQSRPITPLPKPVTTSTERPRSGAIRTTFQGVDYLKHSPTLGTMWGRQKGEATKADYRTSERLEPIPVKKPDVVKQASSKTKNIKQK